RTRKRGFCDHERSSHTRGRSEGSYERRQSDNDGVGTPAEWNWPNRRGSRGNEAVDGGARVQLGQTNDRKHEPAKRRRNRGLRASKLHENARVLSASPMNNHHLKKIEILWARDPRPNHRTAVATSLVSIAYEEYVTAVTAIRDYRHRLILPVIV